MDRDRIIGELHDMSFTAIGRRTKLQIDEELGRGGNGVVFSTVGGKKNLVAKIYIPPDSRDLDDPAFKRFQREIELVDGLNHPFVVRSEGVGVIRVGAYQLPYYLMARAKGTLRDLVPQKFSPTSLKSSLRVFMRMLLGVSYLHNRGIVHRDLKPENVLLFGEHSPRVSDLGICHVAPGFVEWSQLTVEADRLMNWDYYAPEQRHGDATKVDHRADIYALGLILYELISGIQPVRPNLPQLGDIDPILAGFAPVFAKMTEHEPHHRYTNLDLAIDQLMWVLSTINDVPDRRSPEISGEQLVKFIRSRNQWMRDQALPTALGLGDRSLPILHEEAGNVRLDVALTAYAVLGEMKATESVPVLVSGLYPRRSATKVRFPTSDAASQALSRYPVEVRVGALDLIKDEVQASDIQTILNGVPTEAAYPEVERLYREKLIHKEFGEPGLVLLVRLDADRAWPLVRARMESGSYFSPYAMRDELLPIVGKKKQLEILEFLLSGRNYISRWELYPILTAIERCGLSVDQKRELMRKLIERGASQLRNQSERRDFIQRAYEISAQLEQKNGTHQKEATKNA